jgi:hypothetical protein
MIEKYVTSAWSAVAPGLGNHLWQSTLVALMAGLLTLACENITRALAIGCGWLHR